MNALRTISTKSPDDADEESEHRSLKRSEKHTQTRTPRYFPSTTTTKFRASTRRVGERSTTTTTTRTEGARERERRASEIETTRDASRRFVASRRENETRRDDRRPEFLVLAWASIRGRASVTTRASEREGRGRRARWMKRVSARFRCRRVESGVGEARDADARGRRRDGESRASRRWRWR